MYKDYLQSWIEEDHELGQSPLSYEEWKQADYISKTSLDKEWTDLKITYNRLTNIAKEIEQIRVSLYNNRAHRALNSNWEKLDNELFKIQSNICWADTEQGFGSVALATYC